MRSSRCSRMTTGSTIVVAETAAARGSWSCNRRSARIHSSAGLRPPAAPAALGALGPAARGSCVDRGGQRRGGAVGWEMKRGRRSHAILCDVRARARAVYRETRTRVDGEMRWCCTQASKQACKQASKQASKQACCSKIAQLDHATAFAAHSVAAAAAATAAAAAAAAGHHSRTRVGTAFLSADGARPALLDSSAGSFCMGHAGVSNISLYTSDADAE